MMDKMMLGFSRCSAATRKMQMVCSPPAQAGDAPPASRRSVRVDRAPLTPSLTFPAQGGRDDMRKNDALGGCHRPIVFQEAMPA